MSTGCLYHDGGFAVNLCQVMRNIQVCAHLKHDPGAARHVILSRDEKQLVIVLV